MSVRLTSPGSVNGFLLDVLLQSQCSLTYIVLQQALQKSMSSVNFNSASLAAMAYAMMNGEAAMEEHTSTEQAVEALQDALRSLPSKEHVQMLLLKEELENSAREAAAADAAVAAVAKVRFTSPVDLTSTIFECGIFLTTHMGFHD